ncbi:MAG TPA: DUF5666 domain-containing protein [Chloroflexota bacterium]
MRKPIMGAAVLAAIIFLTGYLVGQVRTLPSSFAAAASQPDATWTDANSNFAATRFHPWGSFRNAAGTSKHADGTVTAVNGDTVTVKADSDTGNPNEYSSVTTIVLTGSTQYNAPTNGSSATAGKSSVKTGTYIMAEGTVSSDGKTLTATRVSILPAGAAGGHGCNHGTTNSGSGQGTAQPTA